MIIVLALLFFFLIKDRHDKDNLQVSYEKALEQSDFEEIIAIHEQIQSIIADIPTPASESDSEKLADAIRLRDNIEIDLTAFTQAMIESVLKGNPLSGDNSDKLSLSMTIVGDSSLENIDAVLRDYLLDSISEAEYIHFLETLYPIREFRRFLNDQVDEFNTIREFKTELEPAYLLLQQADYTESANAFEDLSNSGYARIRALNRILQDLRKESLDHLYNLRMPQIQQLIDQGRLYDASLIIESIVRYYPDKEELKQAKMHTDKMVPKEVISWSDPIEAISVKPLIADPDRAFDNDVFSERANEDLLTAVEFRLLLEALYGNDYVLINGSEIVDEEGKIQQVLVPVTKKPLLLFLDEFYFTPQRVESGICKRLDLDENSNVLGVVQDRQGREELESNSTAIDVLENFLLEYPDFTFNGAKAVIVLSGVDGLLGYPLHEEHVAHMRIQAQGIGLDFYLDSLENTEANKDKLERIIETLQEKQWVFASQSYNRISVPDQNFSSLSWDTERMRDEIAEITGAMNIFSFHGGNHVEAKPLLAGYLADSGFVLQSGSGTPYAYTVQKSGYVYIDRQQITAEKLRDPLSNALDNFVTDNQIIVETKRPH